MIKHLFKLIWNKKKENFLLISEILVSFIVLFAVLTLAVHFYRNYRLPDGFVSDHVWRAELGNPVQSTDKDSVMRSHQQLKNVISGLDKVRGASFNFSNVPYSNSMSRTDLVYQHLSVPASFYTTDKDYAAVMGVRLIEGRWFSDSDRTGIYSPIVINASTAHEIGFRRGAVGKVVEVNGRKRRIVGGIQDMKDESAFQSSLNAMYTMIDTSTVSNGNTLLIKVLPDADARFEEQLFKLIAGTAKTSSLEISHLTQMKVRKNKEVLVPMIILSVISAFLVGNDALGLFGVLWYNINRRKGEIGLRRAVGASAMSVYGQLIGETLVLATLSMAVGVFFALQFPLLHVFDLEAKVYLTAILLAVLIIYLLVFLCALYPGRQAASIQPAVALHED